MQPIPRQENVSSIPMPPGREELAQAMHEFLVWLEETKGLTLCNAFKPQYDWYMPAFANKERLAHEFLGKGKSARHEMAKKASAAPLENLI